MSETLGQKDNNPALNYCSGKISSLGCCYAFFSFCPLPCHPLLSLYFIEC